ncbi:hypothetical protein E2562_011832 [Oryza meyeriana var. granulata]|uniref:Uncharacterized protein n=1 Tax=Oryza meyeriana var. granulata TaxID=110450 RepID=A0A6G1CPB6_9ORYZ|nr:hypothetical protein E2562_011832 [Oryza meyeriana var. granulata]
MLPTKNRYAGQRIPCRPSLLATTYGLHTSCTIVVDSNVVISTTATATTTAGPVSMIAMGTNAPN